MIARLQLPAIPGREAPPPYSVELPAAPVVGDELQVDLMPGVAFRVADRKFIVPTDGESSVLVRLERVEVP